MRTVSQPVSPFDEGPPLLDVAAFAERAGLPANHVRSYLSRGYLPEPTLKIGRTNGWTEEQVDAWIEERRAKQQRRDDTKAARAAGQENPA